MQKILVYFSLFLLTISTVACQSGNKNSVKVESLSALDFSKKLSTEANAQLLDVRTEGEFAEKKLGNALNLDYNNLEFRTLAAKFDKQKPTFVYCLSGARSKAAAAILSEMGFAKVYNLEGGILAWQHAGLPLAKAEKTAEKGMTMADYEAKIKSDKYVLVDFNAVWCAPCKKIKPILTEIAEEQKAKLDFLEIDIDENPLVAENLDIQAIPQIYLYKSGKLVWEHKGLLKKEDVLNAMK
jgi:thioredoxin